MSIVVEQRVLPQFSGWRVAYAGSDGKLHAVAADGSSDVTGIPLPDLTSPVNGLNISPSAISPDGHLVAYAGTDGRLVVLNTTGSALQISSNDPAAGGSYKFWSPDETRLSMGNGGAGSVLWVDGFNGVPSALEGTPTPDVQAVFKVLGWTDNTHLAVLASLPLNASQATTLGVGVLDINSESLRVSARVPLSGLGTPNAVLSPDGRTVLLYGERFRADPYTPTADIIDLASGAVTPLPSIARLETFSGFTSIGWQAGTSILAATTAFAVNGGLRLWEFDVRTDAVTQLSVAQYPATYVVGWMPGGGPLIVTSDYEDRIGRGPFTIQALQVNVDGTVKTTVLTQNAMTFPCLGFVRTS